MAYLNNIYGNAAYTGAIRGMASGRPLKSGTAADYLKMTQAAQAIAIEVDSLIPFDAAVTTGAGITQLAITTNTIAAAEQWKAGLLSDIASAAMDGRFPTDTTAADYLAVAQAIVALWTEAVLLLVIP